MLLSASRYRHLRELARLDVNPYANAYMPHNSSAPTTSTQTDSTPGATPRSATADGNTAETAEQPTAAVAPGGSTSPSGTVLAGGTYPELLSQQKEETRIIAGLLDYYQWAQYDSHLMDFAERYCRI